MEDDMLPMLQRKWESKLLETRVADFALDPTAPAAAAAAAAEASSSTAPAPEANGSHPAPEPNSQASNSEVQVKSEPEDPLRLRGGAVSYSAPISN